MHIKCTVKADTCFEVINMEWILPAIYWVALYTTVMLGITVTASLIERAVWKLKHPKGCTNCRAYIADESDRFFCFCPDAEDCTCQCRCYLKK